MSAIKPIPVIDLFAGPGGLGEGFSSVYSDDGQSLFDIRLSIEKDENAHQTLELRSFVHQFPKGQLPDEYYDLLRETNLAKRTERRQTLFEAYPEQAKNARNIAWLAELGGEAFPDEVIDERIRQQLKGEKDFVLIGGPPCQAYSLVGRSRRQERTSLNADDHRVYLYEQYLRIIAMHQPAVFVMENVKGLLSAKLGDEKIFPQIRKDLQNPAKMFPETQSKKYRIYSLTAEPKAYDDAGNPINKDEDYLIKAELYGVPQRRHRVILLGVRGDIGARPEILQKAEREITLQEVIGDLPKLRSSLGRSIESTFELDGKKKRKYKTLTDDQQTWGEIVHRFRAHIVGLNGFDPAFGKKNPQVFEYDTGSEYLSFKTPSKNNPLKSWYIDTQLEGVCNHQSRSHLDTDLLRYQFSAIHTSKYKRFPRLAEFTALDPTLVPDHKNAQEGIFDDRFRTQMPNEPATTVTCHIAKDGHYFIHFDPEQCRSWTVREAARVQTFPDNYLFCGSRTAQFHQVGNAVPPYLAMQIGEVVKKILE